MKRRLIPMFIGLLITGLFVWLEQTSNPLVARIKDRMENILYDKALALSTTRLKPSESKIVIVDVDEESISQIGRWPWTRKDMITLVKRIHDDGAVVIAFDMVFSEPELSPIDELRQIAAAKKGVDPRALEALSKLEPLVLTDNDFAKLLTDGDFALGFVIHDSKTDPSVGTPPPPVFELDKKADYALDDFEGYFANLDILQKSAKNGGFLTALPDDDGVIRRAPLVLRIHDKMYTSLALEASRLYLLADKISIEWTTLNGLLQIENLRLGEHKIFTDEQGEFLIPFRGKSGKFPYVSAADVIKGKENKGLFENALVFIGSSALGFGDLHATPMEPTFPGVEIQATIADSIIEGRSLFSPPWGPGLEILLSVLLGVFLGILFPFLGVAGIVIAAFTSLIALLGGYYYLLSGQGIVVSVTTTLGLILTSATFNLGYGLFVEGSRRKNLKNLFGQYVPKENVELMAEHPERYNGEGLSENLTVLFADIVGFTTVSSTLDAKALRTLLNQYFTPMTRVIFENHGTVDKYVGDMIMAFWGAPIPDANHAHNALSAALAMRKEVERLKVEFLAHNLPKIEIGIGLNTGDMFVGDMGSEYRRAYTVLGDTVNVASRLEGLTRFYGVHTAVGEPTRHGQTDFVFRLLDRVMVKGRHIPLEIFELVGKQDEVPPEKRIEIDRHEKALALYFAKDWAGATAAFVALSKDFPDAKLYTMFLERIEEVSKMQLPDDWDGAYQWTSK